MKRKILVLEDEKPLLNAVTKGLMAKGFEVLPARSVSQGLACLEKTKIDAIWLDHYLLGDKSGLDFVMILKSEKSKWKHIPIFVVSNTATADKIKYYLELGVEQFHTKADVRMDFLINEIEKSLKA